MKPFSYSNLSFVRLSLGKTMDELAKKLAKFGSSWTPTQVCFLNTAVIVNLRNKHD